MLESIHIENIALIKQLDISFSGGFSAFTGETGAGKSIIIDSIGMICGNRAQKELIRAGSDYALAEAVFSNLTEQSISRFEELGIYPDEDGYIYVSRRLSSDGKSVCRINSRQVPSSLLRELSAFLINIHGQHDNQDLLKKEMHLGILDSYIDDSSALDNYKELYKEYTSLSSELESITTDETEKARNIEILKFQIEEIASLKLKPDEEDKLFAEKKRLTNKEKISDNANLAYAELFAGNQSAVESIDSALAKIKKLAEMCDGLEEHIDRLQAARSEVYDIAEYINELADNSDEDPTATLDRVEKRLFDIYKLKRKYGPDVPSILEFLDKSKNQLGALELSDIRSEELRKKLSVLKEKLDHAASVVTNQRTKGAEKLKKEIEAELGFLEMSKVEFSVQILPKECTSNGADDVEFLVRTNTGLPFSPLAKTASGGELSRIMLAIKSVIARKDGVETVIFDEVDTGISGKTSRRIGIKLLQTSKHTQVMCVTHSAQIASLSDSHFKVSKFEKDGTTLTGVKLLSKDERIDETARIISGINITDSSRNAALELIEESKNFIIQE